ncbi:MAG: hypothetical protein KGJ07_06025 [Patescibacteria group bacterium]|nr:hypothetical protein [Patescibacteria group bacterium]MDE2589276.1 hypothetical protein [Patescibacteria group bacterium]
MHSFFAGLFAFFMGITSFLHGGQAGALANNPNQQVLHAAISPVPSGTPGQGKGRGRGFGLGMMPTNIKGTKFADNTQLNQHAYLVYPVSGDLPADAKVAMSGWELGSTQNADGSTTVTLTPSNSEQEDHKQTFTLQSGDKLYFVELNLQDDQNGNDHLWFDDLGIVTDSNGIIQNDLPKPSFPPRGQSTPSAQ